MAICAGTRTTIPRVACNILNTLFALRSVLLLQSRCCLIFPLLPFPHLFWFSYRVLCVPRDNRSKNDRGRSLDNRSCALLFLFVTFTTLGNFLVVWIDGFSFVAIVEKIPMDPFHRLSSLAADATFNIHESTRRVLSFIFSSCFVNRGTWFQKKTVDSAIVSLFEDYNKSGLSLIEFLKYAVYRWRYSRKVDTTR